MQDQKTDLYVWLDVETTGLDPETCAVIEVGFIITDGPETGFREIPGMRGEIFVDPQRPGLASDAEKEAFEMHRKSGRWAAWCDAADSGDIHRMMPTRLVDQWLRAALEAVREVVPGARFYLAARNPQFDRRFIESDFPRFAKEMHYRNFDVSALCLVDPSLYDYEHGVEGEPHRAMYDILRDLEYAREFVRRYRR